MICPSRTPGLVVRAWREIAAELAAEALDPKADLRMADRRQIAGLLIAVETEVARITGVEPRTAEAVVTLVEGLALIEAAGR